MRMRLLPTVALCCVAGVLAAAAGASYGPDGPPLPATSADTRVVKQRSGFDPGKSPDLWATINVCDTPRAKNTIGIRGSMPGLRGRRPSVLQMRFSVQFKTGPGRWRDTGRSADSGWLRLGRTRTEVIETGQDFRFRPPATGQHTLRGVVRYRWKRGGRIVERKKRTTEVGHRSTAGADPAGYSASQCRITAP